MPDNNSNQGIPDVDVRMIHHDLAHAPRYALPEGYHMRFYRDGDVATWVRIQRAADALSKAAAETFAHYMPGDTAHLARRVMFLVDPSGVDIGTITAWNGDNFDGRDIGLVHWVAIAAEAQGRGLAKPMLSAVLDVLRALGYNDAWLDTNTRRIPALNLYLLFGFEPHPRSDVERAAWRAVAELLKYPVGV